MTIYYYVKADGYSNEGEIVSVSEEQVETPDPDVTEIQTTDYIDERQYWNFDTSAALTLPRLCPAYSFPTFVTFWKTFMPN